MFDYFGEWIRWRIKIFHTTINIFRQLFQRLAFLQSSTKYCQYCLTLSFGSLFQYFHRFFYLSVCLIIFCFHPIISAIWNENQISYTKKADFLIWLKKRLRLSEIMWEIQFRNDWKWNDEFFGHFYRTRHRLPSTESKMQTIEMEINIRFQAFCSKFRGIWSALVWYWAMLVAKHILSFSFYITDVSTIHITYYVTLIIIIK